MEPGPAIQFFTGLRAADLLLLLAAAGRTLGVSAISITAGTLLGCALGWVLAAGGKAADRTLGSLLDVFRSVPLLIQLILFNSFFPIVGYPLDAFQSGTIVLTVVTAAYVASIARGGIEAVPAVIRRAARSLGLNARQEFVHVVVPIGLRAVLPAWIGISLSILKDSSLVSVLGYAELLYQSQKLIVRTQEPLLVLLISGGFYFLLSYPLSHWGSRFERRSSWQLA